MLEFNIHQNTFSFPSACEQIIRLILTATRYTTLFINTSHNTTKLINCFVDKTVIYMLWCLQLRVRTRMANMPHECYVHGLVSICVREQQYVLKFVALHFSPFSIFSALKVIATNSRAGFLIHTRSQ